MRLLVCGGRNYNNTSRIQDVLDGIHAGNKVSVLIHGSAYGADFWASKWAGLWDIPEAKYPALWQVHGKKAGPIRNQQMIDEGKPDLVVAFPGGRGTADMVARAQRAGIRIVEVQA